ncbi:MAG: hypothetical protein PSX81_09690 [bacterium]|nr:hypothetical protein [bacterium]
MEKRLMRLVWNYNDWETPIERKYNTSLWKDGKNDASFEKSFGFGGEDWLFNSRYNIDGFQYGYIRGVDKLSSSLESIDELFLYTIDSASKKRLLVAKIMNVEIIEGYDEIQNFISPIINGFLDHHIDELKVVGADYQRIIDNPLQFNVRFKLEDVTKYGYLNEIKVLSTPSFSRFTPYIVDNTLEKKLLNNIITPSTFIFKKGKSKSVEAHKRTNLGGQSFNKRVHSDITEDLYKYLIDIKSVNKDKISIENSRVGGCVVDGVIQHTNTYSFFEIKTASTAIANIRDAMGQLIEYSHLDKNTKIEKLIIVGPAMMNNEEEKYFNRIRNAINLKLEYWGYKMNEKKLKDKFKVY